MNKQPLRILLVDDDEDDFVITRDLFDDIQTFDVVLDWVANYQQALVAIEKRQHDVYLFDYRLGDRTGLDLLREIIDLGCDTPVILLTGQGDHEIDLEAMRAGAADYLVKGRLDATMLERTVRYTIERQRTAEQIKSMAYYDTLTNLPNRALFKLRLSQVMSYCERHECMAALMFLDIDHFKRINDTLGHAVGDELLQAVATRLLYCVRQVARLSRNEDTVSRLGGDEFTVILAEIKNEHDVAIVADRIIKMFSTPILLGEQKLFVSVSIGIALFPEDGTTIDTLTKNADAAMYHAKMLGRNNYQIYQQNMNDKAAETLHLENDLRNAVEQREFVLHYQPLMDTKTGKILSMEALLRWQHPEKGLVSPAEFIPQIEENGLIVPIGEWVIHQACQQNKIWQNEGYPPVRVAVNLSAQQFKKCDLPKIVAQALRHSGLNPQYLELEITESVLMHDIEEAIAILKALKSMGVWISMDDFGTGYSSFGNLKRFPLDILKIDRSFIKEMHQNEDDAAIVRAILAMTKSMRLITVAEGVENHIQLNMLSSYECDKIQGYLLSPPMCPTEVGNFLTSDNYQQRMVLSYGAYITVLNREGARPTDPNKGLMTILMADDDEDDRLMTQEALEESLLVNPLRFVKDGEELMDYLHRRGPYVDPALSPKPGLILLDLNMPRKDGREALKEIKNDPNLKHIPVVILTTSKAEEDVLRSYNLGVNSFIVKPVSFQGLVDMLATLGKYWFQLVEIPVSE